MGVDLDQVEKEVLDAQAVADDQGNNVRALKAAVKAGEATKDQLNQAIALLKKLKADLDVKRKAFDEAVGGGSKASSVNKEAFRQALQNVLLSRCFPSTSSLRDLCIVIRCKSAIFKRNAEAL